MRIILFLFVLTTLLSVAQAHPFSLVVYNVENLFDVDGVAVYDDYQSGSYTPAHMATKLGNISKVLANVNKGEGPDIILFNEIEADQTPGSTVSDADKWIKDHEAVRYDAMLAQQPLPSDLVGVPAEVWLQKALSDEGMTGYHVVNGDDKSGSIAIKCVIFSRFPVKRVSLFPTQRARPIIQAELDVDGHTLYVFNNHWKSGAGNVETESDRRANAKTLRDCVDNILAADPNADIIIGGDLNSQYNHKIRYRDMGKTGINDVLGSQGNELAIRGKDRDLYNLWFELPSDQRGSDVFKGEWGTLVHILLSRGLYDMRGVQYEDNSFAVMKIPGLNTDSIGLPNRWKPFPAPGSGFSDHFPLYARFTTVDDARTDKWMALVRPTTDDSTSVEKVDYASVDLFKNAIKLSELPPGTDIRTGDYMGKIFYVSTKATVNTKGHVLIKFNGADYDVFSHEKEIRDDLRDRVNEGRSIRFYGELGTFRGKWQFVVQGKEWVK